jgi:iron complex transport system ATP-binding protein
MSDSVIKLEDVRCTRQGRDILHGVNWELAAGQHWAIIGANGAGKTTLLQIAVGYVWPNEGRVWVLGQEHGQVDLRCLRRRIGWVSSSLEGMIHRGQTALQIVLSGAFGSTALFDKPSAGQRQRADALLGEMGCQAVAAHQFGVLSLGEQQKVLIARALMAQPKLLILDEPCAGLDIPSRESILGRVEALCRKNGKAGMSVVMVTHHIEEIPPSVTHVLALRRGKILAAGTKDAVLTPEILGQAFGLEFHVDQSHGRYWPRVRGQW